LVRGVGVKIIGSIRLIRFKDDTYAWSNNGDFSGIFPLSKAIAHGVWNYKLSKKEIEKALKNVPNNNHNNYVALFSPNGEFLLVDQIQMENA